MQTGRTAKAIRKSKETQIEVALSLDGTGVIDISTGIGFFDHMLTAFAVHGGLNLTVKTSGDLEVDTHHTIEDTGIVLGKAIYKALGDKSGIVRFGQACVPMDEALSRAVLDISGRPYLVFNADFSYYKIGEMASDMVEEFFRALTENAGITLHIECMYGSNDHHKCEALFKAFARAFRQAVVKSDTGNSTKGMLDI